MLLLEPRTDLHSVPFNTVSRTWNTKTGNPLLYKCDSVVTCGEANTPTMEGFATLPTVAGLADARRGGD